MGIYSGQSAVGAFFPGTISIDWVPDPNVVANELLVAAGRIEDRSRPLALSREVMVEDVVERFETQTSPEGEPWKPWAPSYVPKAGPSLLVLTGDLVHAATSTGSYPITEDSIFLSTAGWPDYWAWHQFGAERRAGGESAESSREFMERAQSLGLEFLEGVDVGGIGINTLPARPYIGPSFEAQLRMLEIFDQWFGGIVSSVFTRGGRAVAARRHPTGSPGGIGGQFAKIE